MAFGTWAGQMCFDLNAAVGALPGLHTAALARLAERAPCPVATYLSLLSDAATMNLESDAAAAFRRRFNAFYGVRRNDGWRQTYYRLFEQARGWDGPDQEVFERSLDLVFVAHRRVEASFASKLVATLRPDAVIVDSVVRQFLAQFGLRPPAPGLDEARRFYAELTQAMSDLVNTPQAGDWFLKFDAAFANTAGAVGVSPTKKLDFLIWAGSR